MSCKLAPRTDSKAGRFLPLIIPAVVFSGALALLHPQAAGAAELRGLVASGAPPMGTPLAAFTVTLYGTDAKAKRCAERLGSAVTDEAGAFSIIYTPPVDAAVVLYAIAGNEAPKPKKCARPGHGPVALASVLGTINTRIPTTIVINERTTVASAFAMAQFLERSNLKGKPPGLQNAAMMVRNLVDLETGSLAETLLRIPNLDTSTRRTFNSLANLIAVCVNDTAECPALLTLAAAPRGRPPRDTLQALVDIVHYPWLNDERLEGLFQSSLEPPAPYQPALTEPPDAWILALRFDGDGTSMSGPGNIAFDAGGNAWVTNNFDFAVRPENVCGSDLLLRFTPTGQYFVGSPYQGGGLSGAGFGITLDPGGNVWVGNFGFKGPECDEQVFDNSVSKFSPDGMPLSPGAVPPLSGGGFTNGSISKPQGTVSDRQGNIWIASCASDTIVQYPRGDHTTPNVFAPEQLDKPFDIAFNRKGWAFVTGNASNNVLVLRPDGSPAKRSPVAGDGLFDRPLGIAADSKGNMWVANTAAVDMACPTGAVDFEGVNGSITFIKKNGKPVKGSPFKGGGLTIPWGIAVDGNDNVWVANFFDRRISQFCGRKRKNCPPGLVTGDPISPDTGYGFDGLARSTSVQIDPSGNVWAVNNFQEDVETHVLNPGGRQIVIFIGLAAPIETPLIGPPRKP